jgi:tRNA-dihydrouridine synthase B
MVYLGFSKSKALKLFFSRFYMNRLKKLNLKSRVFLAPMEEVNDPAFRILCKKAGSALNWTPLTNPQDPRKQFLEDKPILQLFSTNIKGIKQFMKKYDSKVSGWDFNLGCPAKTAKAQGYGAYLTDLKIIEKIIKAMRENTKKPLCMKIRKSPLDYKLLKIAEKYCDWIAIHPRLRNQGYSGESDLEWAKKFKKVSKIPVIYSGNVSEKNHESLLKTFDYVMIARAAIGHPEIFSKITKTKYNKTFKDYLSLAKKFNLPFRQIKFQAMQFTKGQRNSRKLRDKLVYTKSIEEIEKLIIS